MDPDNHEPAGAPVPEGRARRELTALETKRIISELLLRVEDHADLSTLKHGSLTAVSKHFHVDFGTSFTTTMACAFYLAPPYAE